MKKSIAFILCFVLLSSIVSVSFASSLKDEVIYMNLNHSGKLNETYIVNVFHSKGKIVDYGSYDKVKNLTDLSEITMDSGKITINTESDNFYYQGNLTDAEMPWDIQIEYYLDGKKIEADDLASKSGKVKVVIYVKKNKTGKEDIYNHFSLQISLSGSSDNIREVVSKDANIAYAGGKTTINYILLPKEEKTMELEFYAEDLEMDPIRFVAVPFKTNFDFDMEGMDNPIKKIDELKNGVSNLKGASESIHGGVRSLSEGLSGLSSGSTKFNDGMQELANKSDALKESSKGILEGINRLNQALNSKDVDEESIGALIQASSDIRSAMNQLSNGLKQYQDAFSQFNNLTDFSELISANEQVKLQLGERLEQLSLIPESDLTPEQVATKVLLASQIELIERTIHALKYREIAEENGAMSENIKGTIMTLEQQLQSPGLPENVVAQVQENIALLKKQVELFESNRSALVAGSTFIDKMKTELNPLIDGLDELSANYNKFDEGIHSIGGLNELKTSVSQLADGYKEFDEGVSKLVDAQKEIANGYSEIDSGIYGSMKGAELLSDGASSMYGGMSQLDEGLATFNIKEINSKVDNLKNKYQFDDYKVKSFVSDKNTNINIQQFILATPPVEKEVIKKEKVTEPKDTSLWNKLKRVFGY